MKLIIDFPDLTIVEHARLRHYLQDMLPGTEVGEDDDRRLRTSTPIEIATAVSAMVGAACAVVGLYFQWRQTNAAEKEPREKVIEAIFTQVEVKLGTRLPETTRVALSSVLVRDSERLIIEIPAGPALYRLTAHEAGDLLLLTGRLAQETAKVSGLSPTSHPSKESKRKRRKRR